jgi:transposase
MDIPRLNDAEWRSISTVLPAGRAMKQRIDDRSICDALLYAAARHCALESLPHRISHKTLRTRQARWKADGTMVRLMKVGRPAITRMRDAIDNDGDLLTRAARIFGWDRL